MSSSVFVFFSLVDLPGPRRGPSSCSYAWHYITWRRRNPYVVSVGARVKAPRKRFCFDWLEVDMSELGFGLLRLTQVINF